jgi:hypothetical protein
MFEGANSCGMNDLGPMQHDNVGSDYMNFAIPLSDDADSRLFGAMPFELLSRSHPYHAGNEDLHYNTRGHGF